MLFFVCYIQLKKEKRKPEMYTLHKLYKQLLMRMKSKINFKKSIN